MGTLILRKTKTMRNRLPPEYVEGKKNIDKIFSFVFKVILVS